jgi:hypothetical protein
LIPTTRARTRRGFDGVKTVSGENGEEQGADKGTSIGTRS